MSQPQEARLVGMEPPAEKAREMANLANIATAIVSWLRDWQQKRATDKRGARRALKKVQAGARALQRTDPSWDGRLLPKPGDAQLWQQFNQISQSLNEPRWAQIIPQVSMGKPDTYGLWGNVPGFGPVIVEDLTKAQAEAIKAGIDNQTISDRQLVGMKMLNEPLNVPDTEWKRTRVSLAESIQALEPRRYPGDFAVDRELDNGGLGEFAPRQVPPPVQAAATAYPQEAPLGMARPAQTDNGDGRARLGRITVEEAKRQFPLPDGDRNVMFPFEGRLLSGQELSDYVRDKATTWNPALPENRELAASLWAAVDNDGFPALDEDAFNALSAQFGGALEVAVKAQAAERSMQENQETQENESKRAQATKIVTPQTGGQQAAQQSTAQPGQPVSAGKPAARTSQKPASSGDQRKRQAAAPSR